MHLRMGKLAHGRKGLVMVTIEGLVAIFLKATYSRVASQVKLTDTEAKEMYLCFAHLACGSPMLFVSC